ncbi:12673_t:CDS:2 [Funneliformis mosseae]|uniref:12673_t:CDS:1 n=1 Tax=Funneliformis mosseae TaxID=27381 RepID=A0A9N9GFS1_FUNMO|nr:12673_t:CDS:2 [Funneliformis mosseae]
MTEFMKICVEFVAISSFLSSRARKIPLDKVIGKALQEIPYIIQFCNENTFTESRTMKQNIATSIDSL